MALQSKQSEGLVIVSTHKSFLRARIRLTALYTVILSSIMVCLSALIYVDFMRDYRAGQINVDGGHELISGTPFGVFSEIFFGNLFVLLIAMWASYRFASYTLRPIQRSMEIQRAFLANASHELHTPLAVMKNDIEVLLREHNPSKDEVATILKSNLEEIDRMAKMSGDLLAVARFDREVEPMKIPVDIFHVAQSVIARMRVFGEKKDVTLSVVAGVPTMVHGDESQLERVFVNLIQNAISHTKAGGTVTATVTSVDHTARITITDTGVGISNTDLPHVFEKFYKGAYSEGTGLGLPIVLGILTQHNGTVSIESTEGVGTTVTVSMPLLEGK